MMVVTTDGVPGHRVTDVYGLVQGTSVRARHLGKDILAYFKNSTCGTTSRAAFSPAARFANTPSSWPNRASKHWTACAKRPPGRVLMPSSACASRRPTYPTVPPNWWFTGPRFVSSALSGAV